MIKKKIDHLKYLGHGYSVLISALPQVVNQPWVPSAIDDLNEKALLKILA